MATNIACSVRQNRRGSYGETCSWTVLGELELIGTVGGVSGPASRGTELWPCP